MKLITANHLPVIPKMKLAVVGHMEWVTFLALDKLPTAGNICHSSFSLEEPAGGGAVAAVQMANLIGEPVHFFTSLGKDSIGEKSHERLNELNLKLHVAWRDKPTRRGISMIDSFGERAITVIGERLQPSGEDDLPWNELKDFDAVFMTASDALGIHFCRKAKVLTSTPRINIKVLNEANVILDALIGSGLDPDEKVEVSELNQIPQLRIATEGANGGKAWPGGRYNALKLDSPLVDAYGCGDSFAAGVTTGLAAKWSNEQAISLGSHCGAICATNFGPYKCSN